MSQAGSNQGAAEEGKRQKGHYRDSIESSINQDETRHETADGSRHITFAHDSIISPPMTSHMQRLPGLEQSINTPNSFLIQSTISDEGVNGLVEQGPESFMANRHGAPLKSSHQQKRQINDI